MPTVVIATGWLADEWDGHADKRGALKIALGGGFHPSVMARVGHGEVR